MFCNGRCVPETMVIENCNTLVTYVLASNHDHQ